MNYFKKLLALPLILGLMSLIACHHKRDHLTKSSNQSGHSKTISPGKKIINQAIKAHGGERYNDANYSFVFRKKTYEFKNEGDQYTYSLRTERDGDAIIDILDNDDFYRTINGKRVTLSEKDKTKYSNALNSVIYFATLPHKLSDGAVNKEYVEAVKIKDIEYDVVRVTFDEENGGVDHDDIFYYWINQNTHQIDFLAYSYHVNKGGVRFRSAENKRTVGGIVFQDYINYKAEVGTALSDLPKLWEEGSLKKLSEIKTEQVEQR